MVEYMRTSNATVATITDMTRVIVLLVEQPINNPDNNTSPLVFHSCSLLRNLMDQSPGAGCCWKTSPPLMYSAMALYYEIYARHCNSGTTMTDMEGDLPAYSTVWYHPNGIANILSLGQV